MHRFFYIIFGKKYKFFGGEWNNGIMEEWKKGSTINDQQSSFILLNPVQCLPVEISFFLVGGRSYAGDFLELG